MPKFQINGLGMNAGSSMIGPHWTDDAGNRFHFWLSSERKPGEDVMRGYQPVRPLQIKPEFNPSKRDYSNPPILFMNCPMNADGSYKDRYQEGYFQTRKLNATAKKNAPLVAEVLRRCEEEKLFEKAEAEELAKLEREEREREDAKVQRVGAAVVQLKKELIEEGKADDAKRIVDGFARLPRESMIKFHDIMMRRD